MSSPCIFDQPVSRLAENFNFRADADGVWRLPEPLYEQFLDAFESLVIFFQKTSAVLADDEHRQIIEWGRKRGYILPPRNFLREDLADLGKALRSFDPFAIRQTIKGEVDLTLGQIEGLYRSVSIGQRAVDEIGRAYHRTEYHKIFKYLKQDAEAPYQGPTCISETNNLYFKLKNLQQRQIEFLASPR